MTHNARVLALLSDGCHHSYREGYRLGVMLHSRVADLRRKGYVIECVKRDGGYWYRLVGKAPSPRDRAASLRPAVNSTGPAEGQSRGAQVQRQRQNLGRAGFPIGETEPHEQEANGNHPDRLVGVGSPPASSVSPTGEQQTLFEMLVVPVWE